MNRNSSRICGRKTSTACTPFQTPSSSIRRSQLLGSSDATDAPPFVRMLVSQSLSGCPARKTTWKTAITTARKISGPKTRCSSTLSSRRVHVEAAGV